MNKKNIKEYIKNIDNLKLFLEKLLEAPEDLMFVDDENEGLKEFTNLRLLAKSSSWPEAVPKELICEDQEEEKLFRAEGIISDLEISNFEGIKFLDFGCGEGHVAFVKAGQKASKSVGYDIIDRDWCHFSKKENLIFSTNWEEIEKNGPYDFILCNDVLDHVENPLEELKKIQKVKTPQTGKIFIRIHPWTSRHGSHLYKQLNKAYLHLVFSENELFTMGIEPEKINKVLDPINFYKDLFKQIGFTILKEDDISQPIEQLFIYESIVRKRIQQNWGSEMKYEDILRIIETQFLDFILI